MTIREIREEHLLTVKEMADALGITPGAVSNWEKGKQKMSYKNRKKCIEVFGIDPMRPDKVPGKYIVKQGTYIKQEDGSWKKEEEENATKK